MVNSTGVNSAGEWRVSAGEPSKVSGTINQLQNDLSSDGYIVIKDVLTTEQVESLRRVAKQYLQSGGTLR